MKMSTEHIKLCNEIIEKQDQKGREAVYYMIGVAGVSGLWAGLLTGGVGGAVIGALVGVLVA